MLWFCAGWAGFILPFPTPSTQTFFINRMKIYNVYFPLPFSKQSNRALEKSRLRLVMLTWMADDKYIVTAISDHTMKLWDSFNGNVVRMLEVRIIVSRNKLKTLGWVILCFQGSRKWCVYTRVCVCVYMRVCGHACFCV